MVWPWIASVMQYHHGIDRDVTQRNDGFFEETGWFSQRSGKFLGSISTGLSTAYGAKAAPQKTRHSKTSTNKWKVMPICTTFLVTLSHFCPVSWEICASTYWVRTACTIWWYGLLLLLELKNFYASTRFSAWPSSISYKITLPSQPTMLNALQHGSRGNAT